MTQVTVMNKTGLHARPATEFCMEARKHAGEIFIVKEDSRYNAKSIISIMAAGVTCGDEIFLKADDPFIEEKLAKCILALQD